MDLGLKGRVAAITGGSRGIGFAIAQALLAEDCQVAICARDQAGLDRAVQLLGSGVFGHRADVTRPGEVEAFIEATAARYTRLDILVHFSHAVEINVFAGLRAVRAAVPYMRGTGRGRIVFIASVYGRESGGRAGYNLAKAAEISLAKSLSRELAGDSILVNSVAPGSILFPGGNWDRRRQADPEGIAAFVKSDMPLGRFGKPEEVAAVVAFLASDQASLVSGACWTVDGGQSRSLV